MSDKGENEGGAGTAASDMSTPDAKEELETKTRDFISSVVDLAKTEASQTKDELQVLEQMNTVAASEYAQIADTVKSISSFRDDLLKKHRFSKQNAHNRTPKLGAEHKNTQNRTPKFRYILKIN